MDCGVLFPTRERANNNKVSVWLLLDFWQVKSRTSSKLWLYYLSPHWPPSWISHSDYEVSAQRTYYFSTLCTGVWRHDMKALCKGHRSTEVFKARSFQYLLTSLRVQKHNTGHSCSCRNKIGWIKSAFPILSLLNSIIHEMNSEFHVYLCWRLLTSTDVYFCYLAW